MKRVLITLSAALVLCTMAVVGIASAQTTPAATTSGITVAQATAAPKKDPPKPHFVTVHVGGMGTWNVGSSDLALPSSYCATTQDCGPTGQYQFANPVIHFTYGIQIKLSKKFFLSYAHSYVNQNIGRVGIASKVCSSLPCTAAKEFVIPYTYQKLNDDRVDDAALNWLAGPVTVSGGWRERARMCCGNGNEDSAGETAWHLLYLKLATRVGPGSKYFGKLFGLAVEEEYIPHNTAGVFKASPSGLVVPTQGSLMHTTVTPNITLPIGDPHTSTLAFFGTYLNNFDYFINAPVPYLYNEVDFGLIKKWPPYVTLSVTNSNLYEHHEGYPYSNADTINRNKLLMVLDVALPVL
ncbi:MAG TPA: hypothetical protein VMF11_02525 [Candidatus Baltobacteraceae bacterium]|nr:hypothetical protein [Candidatus Baltobacteraceae bacterium]